MGKNKKFMVVHRDTIISWATVEDNWARLADEVSATWIRTYFNKRNGIRYCLWLAPSEDHLKNIFKNIGSGWESISEVEETVPDRWTKTL